MLDFIGDGLFLRGIGKRRRGFNPASLFAGGTVRGVWFDPSDRTMLYQDTAGTIPANQPGHPVGLMLDKSKGLTLGPEQMVTAATILGSAILTGCTAEIEGSAIKLTNNGVGYGAIEWVLSCPTRSGVKIGLGSRRAGRAVLYNGAGAVSGALGVSNIVYSPWSANPVLRFHTDNNVPGAVFYVDLPISVRELPGYHATQPVAASRPTLARHPKGGRRNLLAQSLTLPAGSATREDGAIYGETNTQWMNLSIGASPSRAWSEVYTLAAGEISTASIYFDAAKSSPGALLDFYFGLSGSQRARVVFGVAEGEITSANAVGFSGWFDMLGFAVTKLPDGMYRLSIKCQNVSGSAQTVVCGIWNRAADPVVAVVTAPQVEVGDLSRYQRVTSVYDVTEAGVEDLWSLAFDGVDDFMVTPAIDLTATDKVGVFAGLRKLSDATIALLLEYSVNLNNNPGSFYLAAPVSASGTNDYTFTNKGTLPAAVTNAGYTAPHSAVVSGLGDIGADVATLRVNGQHRGTASADQGTGSFGNYPLYIGRRAGTSIPFTGNLYGLIVAGKMPTAAEIANTEAYLNGKTGAYAA